MLIAHYPLNGDARDYFGNDGTSTNVTWVDGKIGQAAEFNGNDGSILTGIPRAIFGNSWSVSLWCYFNEDDREVLASSWNSGGVAIEKDTRGRLRIYYNNSPDVHTDDNAVPINSWNHCVFIRDVEDNSFKIYIGGILVKRRVGIGGFDDVGLNNIRLGGDLRTGLVVLDGMLDDVRIYDHALSEKEVQETYKALVLSKFPEVNDNTSDSGNFITVPDSPTILGDTSIEMWLYPTTTVRRQTIWNKGYGGEGTVNFEDGAGFLKFYSGYNGDNNGGYENVDSSVIPLNVWTHAVVTRAMPSGAVKWYLNGQLDTTGNFSFSTIGETTFDLTIGSGYTSDFVGNLEGVRQYATVLSATDVESQYKTGLSIDNIGNMHSKHLDESPKVRYIRDYLNGSTSNSGSHWIEIQANDTDGVNVALNADAYDEVGNPEPELTDGNTNTNSYVSGNTYMEVDLGSVFLLDNVHIWHYYSDGRTYYGTKTEVSVDGQNWITIFDNEVDGLYPETPSGKVHRVRSPSKFSVNYSGVSVGEASEVGVSRGLVSWLPLIGDTKDSVTNEVATNNGATPVGDGYEFDGSGETDGSPTGDYISIPEAITNTSTNNYPEGCTYSVWLNVDTDAVDRMGLFWGSGTIRHIEIHSIGKNFRTEAATQNNYSFGSSSFPDDVRGVWSNFTIVFANGEAGRPVRWYQNGKLFHTGSMTNGSNPEGEYFSFSGLGRATGGSSYTYAKSFDGKIRGFRIYGNTLTPEEVAQEYRSGKASLNKNSAFAKEFIEV